MITAVSFSPEYVQYLYDHQTLLHLNLSSTLKWSGLTYSRDDPTRNALTFFSYSGKVAIGEFGWYLHVMELRLTWLKADVSMEAASSMRLKVWNIRRKFWWGALEAKTVKVSDLKLKRNLWCWLHTGSKITGIKTATLNGDPDAVKVLITSNDSRIRLYNLRDKVLEMKFKGHENTSSQLRASFSDDQANHV